MSIVTKLIGDKRAWRRYRERVRQLPTGHREAVNALERYLLVFGPGSAGRIQSMFDDLVDLFEQNAASGTPVRDVAGDDPVAFAEAFLANYTVDGWVATERRRLVEGIDRAAGKAGSVGAAGA